MGPTQPPMQLVLGFSRGQSGRGGTLTNHISLLQIWVFVACYRLTFTFTYIYILYILNIHVYISPLWSLKPAHLNLIQKDGLFPECDALWLRRDLLLRPRQFQYLYTQKRRPQISQHLKSSSPPHHTKHTASSLQRSVTICSLRNQFMYIPLPTWGIKTHPVNKINL